jgi:outer membrane lipoprotein-sorting protein
MSILLLLAAMAVLPSEALPAEVEEISAGELIKKSEAAYAEVKTYVGTTTVRTKSERGGTKSDLVSKAKISFMRPGKVRIDGRTASLDLSGNGGNPFTIVSDGNKTWKHWAPQTSTVFQEVKNVPMAGMSGVTIGAEVIPAALMKSDGAWVGGFDPFIVPRLSETKLAGHEKIDGADCYMLVAKNPKHGNVTLWIDSKYFLLRQMVRESNETQLNHARESADEALKRIGRQRPGRLDIDSPITSMSSVYSFSIYQVDSRVDEKLFADPTQK